MSKSPITLYDAALALTQALMQPAPLADRPSETNVALVRANRTTLASLAMHDRGIRTVEREDIAAMVRLLAVVIAETDVPINMGVIPGVTALTSAVAKALEGGAA